MERKIVITKDGSHSVSVPEMNVTYHSIHGAIQESMHVFIQAGFKQLISQFANKPINILEMGFGTGLNVLLTLIETEKIKIDTRYEALELYPLNEEEIKRLNYCEQLNRPDLQKVFEQLHYCEWEKEISIRKSFTLLKRKTDLSASQPLELFKPLKPFELIYFDAFAPNTQPELWTSAIFEKLYNMMTDEGILVTYCSKGEVRRNMIAAGFTVEKIPGPPGKREMLRAKK